MRTEIMFVLSEIKKNPSSITADKENSFTNKIMEMYSFNRPIAALETTLENDVLDLLVEFNREDKALLNDPTNCVHRVTRSIIQRILVGIIVSTNNMGIRLKPSFLNRYRKTPFGAFYFSESVENIYKPFSTPEPQPLFLQRDEIVNTFERAVEYGYMTKQDGKYRWVKDKGTLLCALIGTLLFGDEIGSDGDYRTKGGAATFPASDIEKYFELKDISKKRYQLGQKKPPRGYLDMITKLKEQP